MSANEPSVAQPSKDLFGAWTVPGRGMGGPWPGEDRAVLDALAESVQAVVYFTGGTAESCLPVRAVALEQTGSVVAPTDHLGFSVVYRSAAKPFQGIPLLVEGKRHPRDDGWMRAGDPAVFRAVEVLGLIGPEESLALQAFR